MTTYPLERDKLLIKMIKERKELFIKEHDEREKLFIKPLAKIKPRIDNLKTIHKKNINNNHNNHNNSNNDDNNHSSCSYDDGGANYDYGCGGCCDF